MATKTKKVIKKKKTETPESPVEVKKTGKLELNSKNLKIVIILAIITGGLYLVRSLFIVSIVNGRPITRYEVVRQLEKQGGADTLESLTTQVLVRQEAKSRGISLTKEDVDAQIATIEENVTSGGQSLDDLLKLQGMTRNDFTNQVELQLLVEKMLEDKITITDEEIASYIEENKSFMSDTASPEEQKEEARNALKQTKMSQVIQPLLEEIKTKAKIIKFLEY